MVKEEVKFLFSLTRLDILDGPTDGSDTVLGIDSIRPNLSSRLLSSLLLPVGEPHLGDIFLDSLVNRSPSVATIPGCLLDGVGLGILAEVIVRNYFSSTVTQYDDETIRTDIPNVELGTLGNGGGGAVVGVGVVLLEGDRGLDVGDLLIVHRGNTIPQRMGKVNGKVKKSCKSFTISLTLPSRYSDVFPASLPRIERGPPLMRCASPFTTNKLGVYVFTCNEQ